MRRSAYIKALEEASKLPEETVALKGYIDDSHNPRGNAIHAIMWHARKDPGLFHNEVAEILNWKGSDAKDNNDSPTEQTEDGEEDRKCP